MTNQITDCASPFCLCVGTDCSARIAREAQPRPEFRVGQQWRTRDNRLAIISECGAALSGALYPITAELWHREEYDRESFTVTGKWRVGAFSDFDLVELLKDAPATCAHCGRGPGEEACDWIECATVVPQVIYVAGPMTGYPDLNFPAFHAKAAELRAKGYVVINPAELNGGADELAACAAMTPAELQAHWRKCMRKDITALCACDGIAMLDGWTRSKGATLEHHVAKSLGLMVFEAVV